MRTVCSNKTLFTRAAAKLGSGTSKLAQEEILGRVLTQTQRPHHSIRSESGEGAAPWASGKLRAVALDQARKAISSTPPRPHPRRPGSVPRESAQVTLSPLGRKEKRETSAQPFSFLPGGRLPEEPVSFSPDSQFPEPPRCLRGLGPPSATESSEVYLSSRGPAVLQPDTRGSKRLHSPEKETSKPVSLANYTPDPERTDTSSPRV